MFAMYSTMASQNFDTAITQNDTILHGMVKRLINIQWYFKCSTVLDDSIT